MAVRRPFVLVLLPFAAGYYLSYVFRTINALIAGTLTHELGLSPADLGLLIHAHPSLSELFGESALALTGRSLHS